MKTETVEKMADARPHQVTVRLSPSELIRMRDIKNHLALAVHVSDSELAHQLAIIGLAAFERRNKETRKV